jgi:light-regulated signal transduction histidine kinase (bacteriophytochrome)
VQRDGAVRWVHAQAELLRDASGEPERLLGTMVDITERKLAEDQIKKLNAELETRVTERTAELELANKELTAFSYSVSHDLRAPLRHINGYVDLLLRETSGKLSEKAERYLGIIASVSREMGVLIDELLAFSRMSNAEMNQRSYDLGATVRAALEEVRPATQGRQIEWTIGELPRVFGDPNMLKLVFVNLLENAIKFTRPREIAHIEIGCDGLRKGRHVVFVRDDGVGFDSRYKDKLFGVFQRLHRADEFEGTGIGLANVQRIVNRHGGEVWAEGEVDHGATLYVTLAPAETTPAEEGT